MNKIIDNITKIDIENIVPYDKIVMAFIKYYRNCKNKILEELKDLPSKGSIQPKKRGGRYYYYLAYRESDKVKFKYIGKERPFELEKKLKRSKLLKRKLIIIDDFLYSLGITRRINRLSLSQRFKVFERDNFTCQYCGRNVKNNKIILVVDHILPKKLGGSDKLDNLVTSCRDCNLGKHARYYDSIINKD
ncbi:MAG: HNH endonuclease [Candidatus Celaenobacter antarcticus]|nr:HNH endonuclease [Candidatus Celaenobacter antarcticus]MDP8315470.1 HNH endonuclease [Candidatus Celaenobacter antarcticus]